MAKTITYTVGGLAGGSDERAEGWRHFGVFERGARGALGTLVFVVFNPTADNAGHMQGMWRARDVVGQMNEQAESRIVAHTERRAAARAKRTNNTVPVGFRDLPAVVELVEVSDRGEGATCPHCGAEGRFVVVFKCADGKTHEAMRGCYGLWQKYGGR